VMQLVEKNPRPPKAGTASAAETAKRQYHRKSRFGCSSCKYARTDFPAPSSFTH
jgi:transposase-like protein